MRSAQHAAPSGAGDAGVPRYLRATGAAEAAPFWTAARCQENLNRRRQRRAEHPAHGGGQVSAVARADALRGPSGATRMPWHAETSLVASCGVESSS